MEDVPTVNTLSPPFSALDAEDFVWRSTSPLANAFESVHDDQEELESLPSGLHNPLEDLDLCFSFVPPGLISPMPTQEERQYRSRRKRRRSDPGLQLISEPEGSKEEVHTSSFLNGRVEVTIRNGCESQLRKTWKSSNSMKVKLNSPGEGGPHTLEAVNDMIDKARSKLQSFETNTNPSSPPTTVPDSTILPMSYKSIPPEEVENTPPLSTFKMRKEKAKLPTKRKLVTEDMAESPAPVDLNVTSCSCKRTGCLKLYCVCFGERGYCHPQCRCVNCLNTREHESERQDKIERLLLKRPDAFKPKIESKKRRVGTLVTKGQRLQHKSGCHCKRSGCTKRYCECFQAGIPCGDKCVCVECRNRTPSSSKKSRCALQSPWSDADDMFVSPSLPRVRTRLKKSVATMRLEEMMDKSSGTVSTYQQHASDLVLVFPLFGEMMPPMGFGPCRSILSFLSNDDVKNVMVVNKAWRMIATSEAVWDVCNLRKM